MDLLYSEYTNLSKIDSKYIIAFYEYFEDNQNCYIVMEYADNDLESYMKSKKRLDEFDAKQFLL